MITVGAFDAKTHLSSLLDKVESGEEVVITRHGKPIARLVPEGIRDRLQAHEAIERIKALRVGVNLSGLSWKDLRDGLPQSLLRTHEEPGP